MMMDDIIACGAAGMLARIPCHPLDTCKTVAAATEGGLASSSLTSIVRTIYAREGVRGFYRGVGIASVGAAPGVAAYLVSYEYLKHTALPAVTGLSTGSPLTHLMAGFGAEAVSCIAWLPVDVVKERLQTQDPSVLGRYRNSADGIIRVAKHEGLRGLYKGYFMTLASFGPYSAAYFAAFEAFKSGLFDVQAEAEAAAGQAFLCGLLGNATACVLTQPLEVVKTRFQIQRCATAAAGGHSDIPRPSFSYQYTGLVDGILSIVRNDGVRGLWRGLSTRIIYQAPNAAVTFALAAQLKHMAHSRRSDPLLTSS